MEDFFIKKSNLGIMDEQEEDIGSFSSFDEDDEEEEGVVLSLTSSSSDLMDEAISSESNDNLEEEDDSTLFEMSNIFAQLPLRRGLSKHFEGKSQSFSSLCEVMRLEDLAKPEKTYKKKLKSSKSYGGGLDCHKALSFTKTSIIKKHSRSNFSSLGPKKQNFFSSSSKPPIPPQRSSGNLSAMFSSWNSNRSCFT